MRIDHFIILGLITDPNVDELGFYNSRLEAFERQQFESNVLNNKCLQALRNQVLKIL